MREPLSNRDPGDESDSPDPYSDEAWRDLIEDMTDEERAWFDEIDAHIARVLSMPDEDLPSFLRGGDNQPIGDSE